MTGIGEVLVRGVDVFGWAGVAAVVSAVPAGAADVLEAAFSALGFLFFLSFAAGGPLTSGTGRALIGPAGGPFVFADGVVLRPSLRSHAFCSRAKVLECSSRTEKCRTTSTSDNQVRWPQGLRMYCV